MNHDPCARRGPPGTAQGIVNEAGERKTCLFDGSGYAARWPPLCCAIKTYHTEIPIMPRRKELVILVVQSSTSLTGAQAFNRQVIAGLGIESSPL